MLIVVVLFATVLLRAAIVLTFVYLMLPVKRVCPHCGAPLALIQHTVLRRLLPVGGPGRVLREAPFTPPPNVAGGSAGRLR